MKNTLFLWGFIILCCCKSEKKDNPHVIDGNSVCKIFDLSECNYIKLSDLNRNNIIIKGDTIAYFDSRMNEGIIKNLRTKNEQGIQRIKIKDLIPLPSFDFENNKIYYPEVTKNAIMSKGKMGEAEEFIQNKDFFYPVRVTIDESLVYIQCMNGLFLYTKKNKEKVLEFIHKKPLISSSMNFKNDRDTLIVAGLKLSSITESFNVLMHDIKNQKQGWETMLLGSTYNNLQVCNLFIFIEVTENANNYLYCLNKKTGKIVWRTNIDFSLDSSIVSDSNIFCRSEGGLKCIDVSTGRVKWQINLDNKDFFVFNQTLYLLDAKILSKHDISNGKTLQTEFTGIDYMFIVHDNKGKEFLVYDNKLFWN